MDRCRRNLLELATIIGSGTVVPSATRAEVSVGVRKTRTGRSLAVQTSDGLALAATSHGDETASALAFVRGLRQSRLSWDRQLSLADGLRLVVHDLRRHGDP